MITTAQYTLTLGTAILVCPPHPEWQRVTLHNATKSSNEYVFVGPIGVSTTTGLHIDPGGTLQLQLNADEDLWAVSDPGGLTLHVLRQTN